MQFGGWRVNQRPKTLNTTVTLAGTFFLQLSIPYKTGNRNGTLQKRVVRENREYLFCSFPSSTANSAAPSQILGNICVMHGQWIRRDSSNCTNFAVYSVTNTAAFQTGSVGSSGYPDYIEERPGEQGWRRGEGARLPPMWPGFLSGSVRSLLVLFVCLFVCFFRRGVF